MDDIIDLVSLSDEELKKLIGELTAEELEVSRRRRIIHGQLDILRAEGCTQVQGYFFSRPRPAGSPDPRIVIAAIDQRSVDAIGRFPWPRDVTAGVIEKIRGLGAKVIALDIGFPRECCWCVRDIGPSHDLANDLDRLIFCHR